MSVTIERAGDKVTEAIQELSDRLIEEQGGLNVAEILSDISLSLRRIADVIAPICEECEAAQAAHEAACNGAKEQGQ